MFPEASGTSEVRESERISLREEVREMFSHGKFVVTLPHPGLPFAAWGSYLRKGFPADEVAPLSCRPRQSYLGGGLTLFDSLDSVAVCHPARSSLLGAHTSLHQLMGTAQDFASAVHLACTHPAVSSLARNKTVSLFEVTIRVLGGLLSGHLLALQRLAPAYDGRARAFTRSPRNSGCCACWPAYLVPPRLKRLFT